MKTTRIRLQDILMDAVVEENPTMPADVTKKPVEKGEDIADHMKAQPFTLKLSGSMVDDAASKIETLRGYQKNAELLTYTGRNVFNNMVITNLDTEHSVANAKGFDYSITLQHVRIAKPETFEVNVKNPKDGAKDGKTATKVKAKTNSGRKQIKTTAKDQVKKVADKMQSKAPLSNDFKVKEIMNQSLSDTLRAGMGLGPLENTRTKAKAPSRQKVTIRGKEYEVY